MAEVALENVSKHYGHIKAVDEVSLKIRNKEFMVLLGPSGSGKTTTLRLIAGLETPTKGEILIDGEVVNHLPPKDRNVAMVFQNYALYPHLSARDNIAMPLKVKKMSKSTIKEEVDKVAEILQIRHLLEKKPRHLSGGEQQRVALARAIVKRPRVFLFDEPLSNLDAKLRVTTRGFLKRLQKDLGITTIYVTHDQSEAMTMADRIAVFNHGTIQQVATPDELYERPINRFVAGFIGSPPMNFIEGKVNQEGKRLMFDSPEGIKISLSNLDRSKEIADYVGHEVILGIRPEDVLVSKEKMQDCIEGRVYVVEPLATVNYITVEIGTKRIVVESKKDFRVRINDPIYVRLRKDKLHFFDKERGNRIT